MLAALVAPARGEDCVATPPAALADQLRDALASGDHAGAVEAVHRAEPTFACLEVFATAEDLVAVYQLAGTAAFFDARPDEAAALYRRAVIVSPKAPFDAKDLREDAHPLYDRIHDEVTNGGTGILELRNDVVVDGVAVQKRSSMVVFVGAHLVQENVDGRVISRLITVDPDARVLVGTPDPKLVATEQALFHRRKASFLVGSGALFAVAGGLLTAAEVQKAAFHDKDPEEVDDPALFAVQAQQRINGCTIGGALAAGAGIGVGWHGLTLRLSVDPTRGPGSLAVAGRF